MENKLKLTLCNWIWRGTEEESQHHRIMLVERLHNKVSSPNSRPEQDWLWDQVRLLRAFSTWFLRHLKEGWSLHKLFFQAFP